MAVSINEKFGNLFYINIYQSIYLFIIKLMLIINFTNNPANGPA
jgi:hypothetical protein